MIASPSRLLARALSGECELSPDEWRKSRRALVCSRATES
jgi:hypothetical protein